MVTKQQPLGNHGSDIKYFKWTDLGSIFRSGKSFWINKDPKIKSTMFQIKFFHLKLFF